MHLVWWSVRGCCRHRIRRLRLIGSTISAIFWLRYCQSARSHTPRRGTLIASSSAVVLQSNSARSTRARQALLVAVVLCLESVLFLSFASDYLLLPAYLGL